MNCNTTHYRANSSSVPGDPTPALRKRARRILDADRQLLHDFLAKETALSCVPTPWGTTAFPRLRRGDADDLLQSLRAEFETSVVPGRFFGMPGHFRMGLGVDTNTFAEGLKRIGLALAARSV